VAEANNQSGIGTHVYVNPGLYRGNINLLGTGHDTALPETFEALQPGTVLISGADPYTNWTQYSGNSSIYSTPWTYNFGLCPGLLGDARGSRISICGGKWLSLMALRSSRFFP
jgi:hypothetical protein